MKKMITLLTLLSTMALLAGTHSVKKEFKLDTEGIKMFDLDCGAGSLKIRGSSNLSEIRVFADIHVENVDKEDVEDFIERKVTLEIRQRGNRAYLVSKVHNRGYFSGSAYVDLIIEVPAHLELDIRDRSGSMDVMDIDNNVRIDDGSGSIDVENISGDVDIKDGSGSIDVVDVGGDVTVDDGSGGVNIRKIGGSVTVSDGSGSININYVSADVYIRESGSGGLSIHNVDGNVTKDD